MHRERGWQPLSKTHDGSLSDVLVYHHNFFPPRPHALCPAHCPAKDAPNPRAWHIDNLVYHAVSPGKKHFNVVRRDPGP